MLYWQYRWHVTDLHAHILPGVDDGPRTIDESVALVRLIAALGFDHIFLTPHFRPGFFDSSPELVGDAFGRLIAALDGRPGGIEFTVANEVHLDSVFGPRGHLQRFLTFGTQPRRVLLELPRQTFPFELLLQTVDRLSLEGILVVLAHPEKHPALFEEPDAWSRLRERDVRFQVNLTILAGAAGRRARTAAKAMCRAALVHAFGTDVHRLAQAARFVPRGLRRAARLLGADGAEAIMEARDLAPGAACGGDEPRRAVRGGNRAWI